MAALNFPPEPIGQNTGTQYTGSNGVTYIWDGYKWVGHSPTLAPGSNSISNSGYVVQVDPQGNLVIPDGKTILYQGGGSPITGGGNTSTSWTAVPVESGCPIYAELTPAHFYAYTQKSHLRLENTGNWDIGSDFHNTGIGSYDGSTLAINALTGSISVNAGNDNSWTFGTDGVLTLPQGGEFTSPNYGFSFNKNSGKTGAPELGTDVTFATENLSSDILDGQVYLGSGYGEFRSIYNKVGSTESGLAYAGVEGFNYANYGDVNFAGMVSQTPNIDSMYTVGLSTSGQITIGFTQNGQTQQSTDWSVVVGSLNPDMTVNGLFADTNRTVISSSGSNGIELNTDRGTVLFGNSPECVPTLLTHFHIMKEDPSAVDLFLGDDYNFVKLPGSGETAYGVEIGTNNGNGANTWRFGTDGVLTLPVSTTGTSVIKSTTSTNITVAGVAGNLTSLAWYNIFGELNNSTSTNITIDGSVVYDTEGNLFVLGSTYADGNDFPGANLFLKYSPQGQLLWRKTWTDPLGDACGSYNASMRFLPAESTATIDAIVWASNSDSWTTSDRSGYIGTMDLEGNLVDLQGQARAPLALPDYRITDIVPLFYEAFNGSYVSGSWYDRADTGWYFPAIAGVDFNDVNDTVNYIFTPTDLAGDQHGGGHFKSINAVFGGLWATGSYNSSANGYYINRTILGLLAFSGGPVPDAAYLYTVGNNYPEYGMWIEDSGSDAEGNIYGLINVWGYNNDTSIQYNNYTVLASATLGGTFTIDRWQKKIRRAGADDGSLNVHGLGLANHEGYVYVSVCLYDNIGGGGDFGLLKLDSTTGAVVWARTIGSPFGEGVWNDWEGGYGSSSDIVVDPTGTYISFTAITQDQSTGTYQFNNFTIQYPLDGSLLGTFNDFEITDSIAEFVVTDHDFDVVDITSTANITTATFTVTTATLTASATTVGEGWTNFRWPLEAEVTGTSDQTWTFGTDGKLTFPDATKQTTAYTGILDGGRADNSVGITFVSYDDTDFSGTGNVYITYNIADAGAKLAGVIINGITVDHSQTTIGTHVQGINTLTVSAYYFANQMVDIIAFVESSSGYTYYSDPELWDVPAGPCLVEGTQITMADGTHKSIEDIQHGDLIRVWNFDLGEFSEAQPIWIKCAEEINAYDRFTFSDGTVLNTVGHFIFNKQAGKFTKFIEDDNTPVGTTTFNEHGAEVTLLSKERIFEPTRYYHVWTQYHLNLFSNGILTSHRFNNIYPIVDMKFVKDDRTLRDVSEFAGIDEKYITGVRLQEQPLKYSTEYIKDYINRRVDRTDISNIVEQGI